MISELRRGRGGVTPNQQTITRYLDGFRTNDHVQILSCLTDDVRWTVFGSFRLEGKAAYEAAIDGPEYVGPPELDVVRMVEDGDTVMAELVGRVPRPDGSTLELSMAELFLIRDGLICERRAWVLPLNLPPGANPDELPYYD
jgi:ketosteroid isomerase-like protein